MVILRNFLLLSLLCAPAFAGLPPPTATGQAEATRTTTFNIQTPNNQLTTTGSGTRLIETGNGNVLLNPDFESTATWVVTNSTGVADTTNYLYGKQSLNLTLSSQSGVLMTQSVVPTGKVVGQNWEYSIYLKTTLTTVSVCALENAVEVGVCQAVSSDGLWHQYLINYPASAVSNGLEVKASSSSTGVVDADTAYVGPARNLGNINSTSAWATTRAFTPNNFGSVTTFSYQTRQVGDSLEANVSFLCGTTAGSVASLSMPSGLLIDSSKLSASAGGFYLGTITRTSSAANNLAFATNVFFIFYDGSDTSKIYFAQAVGSNALTKMNANSIGSAGDTLTFSFTVPIAGWGSSVVVNPNLSPTSWAGASTLVGSTSTTGSFVDPGSVSGAVTASPNAANNLTCTATASILGITCTLPKTGLYQVCYSGYLANSATPQNVQVQLTDSANTTVIGTQRADIAYANATSSIGSCSNYNATTLSVGFKIRTQTSGGTATINATGFSVTDISQNLNAPVLVGNVSSRTSVAKRFESASGTCSSSAAALTSGSDWSSIANGASTGQCVLTFLTPFNGTPNCTGNIANVGGAFAGRGVEIYSTTSSTVRLATGFISTGIPTAANQDFTLNCTGNY